MDVYFDSDAHVMIAGQIAGLLMREKAEPRSAMGITSVEPATDSQGNYKPMIDVRTTSGQKFRLIIAEVT